MCDDDWARVVMGEMPCQCVEWEMDGSWIAAGGVRSVYSLVMSTSTGKNCEQHGADIALSIVNWHGWPCRKHGPLILWLGHTSA